MQGISPDGVQGVFPYLSLFPKKEKGVQGISPDGVQGVSPCLSLFPKKVGWLYTKMTIPSLKEDEGKLKEKNLYDK